MWAPIARWDGHYSVSTRGEIRSNRTGRILKPAPNSKGYLVAVVTYDGMRKGASVHVLVAETFIGPRPQGMQTCHGDGDKTNNTVDNLRYDTPRNNELDKVAHGQNHNSNKTHCVQGHTYSPENTAVNAKGQRKCRTCHRENGARRRMALRAA